MDDGERSSSVGLTKEENRYRICERLSRDNPDVITELLSPLLQGKAVCLRVEDPRLPKKKRKYETVLALVPTQSLGVKGGYLLAAMPPYGSELLDPRVDLKVTTFARLGLGFTLSRALVDALKKIYGERHG